jgi:hypothetical protein
MESEDAVLSVYKTTLLDPILSEVNPVHTLTPYLWVCLDSIVFFHLHSDVPIGLSLHVSS